MGKVVTMQASEHASLLEVLSERLLSDFTQELWRKVFLGPGYERIRFEREAVTFLCTDTLDFDWTPQEIETLAARYEGRVERFDHRAVLVFPQARGALQMAMLLQRTTSCRLRIALLSARSTAAVFELDGRERRMAIGTAVRQACTCADRAQPGTIHISAESYRRLGPASEWQPGTARVETEVHGDEVTSAAMTLAPSLRMESGTFA
jgi:hypothetical protein